MRMLVLSAAMLFGFVAQGMAEVPSRILSVVGQAQVATVPDMAVISLGVTYTHERAGDAMDRVNAEAFALLDALAELDVAARDVQTDQLTLSPLWNNGDGPRRITGFVARNMVSVRVRDLDRLGEVMLVALNAGTNEFNGLRFTLQNPAPFEAEARAAAVRDAMTRAGQLADAAGVTLGPIITLNEQGGFRQPQMMAAARSESMAIATGEVAVTASVAITFDLIP